ncbi:MAG TPA: LamG-like jellyroll fold domain-containing protein [Thermoguttaceae bacterium]|nr:LamG-like jellyroll fold domain-containing protein [Thermoguttaceae bacterium]
MPRAAILAIATATFLLATGALAADWRNIARGSRIPDEGYCDQPYVVVTNAGDWLCTLTTGRGHEGQGGQHVVSTISSDHGKTWSELVDIEPADGPAASWVVPLVAPGGRVYVFYTYNGDRIHLGRDDTHGWYAMKYSDDGGRTWSPDRYRLPLRVTACDQLVQDGRVVQMFWGIDKPKTADGRVYFAFTKLGRYFLADGEGWLFCSQNILTEPAIDKIHWELRPAGEHGIRKADFGSVQEEHNMVPLGGERLFCVYRTTMGYPCQTYSDDGGWTWSTPEPMTYSPGGRIVKQPRACAKLWRCANGKFLFWYHLHGGRSFNDRNPAWIIGGVLKKGRIHWSQAEVLLYDENPTTRMSYPDLIEQDDRYWVTETQKTVARIHEIDRTLLEGLWSQLDENVPTAAVTEGRIADFGETELTQEGLAVNRPLTVADQRGFTVETWLTVDRFTPGQVLLDTRNEEGQGWALSMGENRTMRLTIGDGRNGGSWDLDPGSLEAGRRHHVAFVADGGPNVITAVVDGVLCDGGTTRQFGWGRFDSNTCNLSGTGIIKTDLTGVKMHRLRIYDRYLRTAEIVTLAGQGLP